MTMYNHPLNTQRYTELSMIIRSSLRKITRVLEHKTEFIRLTQYSNCFDSNNTQVLVSKDSVSHFYRTRVENDPCTILYFKSGKHLFFHETPDQISLRLEVD